MQSRISLYLRTLALAACAALLSRLPTKAPTPPNPKADTEATNSPAKPHLPVSDRAEFVAVRTRHAAEKAAPWAAVLIEQVGGFRAFERAEDARNWLLSLEVRHG